TKMCSLEIAGAAAQTIAGKPAPTPIASPSRICDTENKKGPPFGEPFEYCVWCGTKSRKRQ
ncbi:hypothetical protein, partial [Pseudomonas sp. NBRC 111133]|uniref:hypothetical protein n=1 Tax=Pseudomonas sp. NBRC 111133 TaxID=1661048 RepID=UPI001C46118A